METTYVQNYIYVCINIIGLIIPYSGTDLAETEEAELHVEISPPQTSLRILQHAQFEVT